MTEYPQYPQYPQQPSYPQQPQQPGYPPPHAGQPQHHQQDQSRRFLNMSGGVLALVIAGVFLLCCIGPVVACFGLGGLGAVMDQAQPDPTVSIVSCQIDNDETLPTADVEWEITNPRDSEGYWSVHITVLDSQGRQVGETYDGGFGIAPGATEVSTVTVFMDTAGGETCEISVD